MGMRSLIVTQNKVKRVQADPDVLRRVQRLVFRGLFSRYSSHNCEERAAGARMRNCALVRRWRSGFSAVRGNPLIDCRCFTSTSGIISKYIFFPADIDHAKLRLMEIYHIVGS